MNYIDKRRYDESPEIKLKTGDLLLAKDGSTLGTVNVIRNLTGSGTVNSSIAIIRPKSIEYSVFFYYMLQSFEYINKIASVKDGMGVPHLFQSEINEFDLIFPAVGEAKKLANLLDQATIKIENTIKNQKIQISLLKSAKQSLISEAVTGKIDLRDWEIIEQGGAS